MLRSAARSDLEAITTLADRVALGTGASPPGGFLVSAFSRGDYQRFIDRADYFYVALEHGKLEGFMLAYTLDRIPAKGRIEQMLKSEYPAGFVLIKQVVVSPEHRRSGVGSRLYQALFRAAPNVAFLAAIVQQPPNPASEAFHRSHGFRPYAEAAAEDGRLRAVWHRPRPGPEA